MSDELSKGIKYLEEYNHVKVPSNLKGFAAFRALMNITLPDKLDDDFFLLQDKIIKEEYKNKTLIDVKELTFNSDIALYKGDITLLKVDAIVNACNDKLLGCFVPLHNCIDNAIHSYAGLKVRKDLMNVMSLQNKDEDNGKCKVTKGYNLPSKYIFHTVGPQINNKVNEQDKIDLRNCYLSCLTKAIELKLKTIAFPCISTGIYGYPKDEACDIAFNTVKEFLNNHNGLKVIFVVFKEDDYLLYKNKIDGKTYGF